MAKGPLAVSWGDWSLDEPQAGALTRARAELENVGTVRWRDGIFLAYHWLDLRGNAIVWDGLRTPLRRSSRVSVRRLLHSSARRSHPVDTGSRSTSSPRDVRGSPSSGASRRTPTSTCARGAALRGPSFRTGSSPPPTTWSASP